MLPIILIVVALVWLAVVAAVIAICASAGASDRRRSGAVDGPRRQRLRLVA